MKKCSKCKVTKPLTDFVRDRTRLDGRVSWCKQCHREKKKEIRLKKKEFEDFYSII
jgi:hypothetical protein